MIALYDGRYTGGPDRTRIFLHAAAPLHHLGYRLHYVDVSAPLPAPGDLRPAGVLSWFGGDVPHPSRLAAWLLALRSACGPDLPWIALGHPGLSGEDGVPAQAALASLGLNRMRREVAHDGTAPMVEAGWFFDLEAPVEAPPGLYPHVTAAAGGETLVEVKGGTGASFLLGARGTAGLWLHDAAALARDPRSGPLWRADPFALFADFDRGDLRPVPDTTTVNGRRLFVATVRAEGFLDHAPPLPGASEGPAVHDLLAENVAAFPDLPVTLVLSPAALTPSGAETVSPDAVAAARALLARPNVSLAAPDARAAEALAQLIPAAGPDVLLFMTEETGDHGAPDTTRPALAHFPFTGRSLGELAPAVAPNPTGDEASGLVLIRAPAAPPSWADPTGLHRLPEWLRRTGTPRRLLPYHLDVPARAVRDFAGQSAFTAALANARDGGFHPMRGLDYVRMVQGAVAAEVVPRGPRTWEVRNRGALATLRLDTPRDLALDTGASRGVLGLRRMDGALYIALDPAVERPLVALTETGGEPGPPLLFESGLHLSALRRAAPCAVQVTARGLAPGEVVWRTRPGASAQATVEGGATLRLSADAAGLLAVPMPVEAGNAMRLDLEVEC
ncbi:MAG: hypothetical protein ACLFRZ_07155 [Rhodosalinus sp.]